MVIEEKKISPTENLLFFPEPQPIHGTFYATPSQLSSLPLICNITDTNLAQTILLTADFLYLQSTSPQELEDLTALTLAEIDDFVSTKPSLQIAPTQNTTEKICIIIKTIIAPYLQKDGGDIELVNFENGTVNVRFLGKCHGCPYAEKTLKNRVEKNLLRYLPEVRETLLI